MNPFVQFVTSRLERCRDSLAREQNSCKDSLPEESLSFQAMFYTFCLYCVFFSSGYGFREVLPPLSGIFLVLFYLKYYAYSNLAAFRGKVFLAVFGVFLLFSVMTSVDPLASLIHVGRGINKQFLVFFLALECARSRRHVRILAWVLLLGCYLQGLACVHQYITGHDIIHNDPLIANRLTGTMAWYWVGSYLLLAGIPTCGVWSELRKKCGVCIGSFITFALCAPIAFGIILGGARASFLALLASAAFYFFTIKTLSLRSKITALSLALLLLVLVLLFFGEKRFALATILHDSRITLWSFSLEVLRTDILTGVGAWQYCPVLQTLDIAKQYPKELVELSHPHNIYLQVLCETGLIGFCLCFIPLFGLFVQNGAILRAHLQSASKLAGLAFFFWLACFAFFIHGLVGHDFFRPWYQALFFSHMGVVSGACTVLRKAEYRKLKYQWLAE